MVKPSELKQKFIQGHYQNPHEIWQHDPVEPPVEMAQAPTPVEEQPKELDPRDLEMQAQEMDMRRREHELLERQHLFDQQHAQDQAYQRFLNEQAMQQ